jgi:hypothetical protein
MSGTIFINYSAQHHLSRDKHELGQHPTPLGQALR